MADLLSVQQIMNAAYLSASQGLQVTNQVSATLLGTPNVGAIQLTSPWVTQPAQGDAGSLRVSALAGGYGYLNVTTSAQTVVKSGSGVLGLVALNTTLTSAIRGYNNTVSGGDVLFTIPAGTAPTSIRYEVRFGTGLTISSGAAADDFTVMYN